MAIPRKNPYGAFRFRVEFGAVENGPGAFEAGFSDVQGLGVELNYSEYRDGTDPVNTVRKVPNTFKLDEVTLKRGLVGSTELFEWLKAVREGQYQPRTVTIVLLDEAGTEVLSLVMARVQPKKALYGPFVAKGGGEVAMEELHLVHEGIDYQ